MTDRTINGMTVDEMRASLTWERGWDRAPTDVVLSLLDALESAQREADEAKKEKDALRADLDRFQGCLNFVTQTKLHDPENGVLGNCFAACIASMMGDGISDIPAFEEMPNDGSEDDWLNRFWEFAERKGLAAIRLPGDVRLDMRYIANGYSGRTKDGFRVRHSCVYQCGRLAFDPHPSGDGLETVDSVWVFVWLPPRIRNAVERAERAEAQAAEMRSRCEYLTAQMAETQERCALVADEHAAGTNAASIIRNLPYSAGNKALAVIEAAKALFNDLRDYERVNHLAPSAGRQYCWQSEEDFARALADFEGGGKQDGR